MWSIKESKSQKLEKALSAQLESEVNAAAQSEVNEDELFVLAEYDKTAGEKGGYSNEKERRECYSYFA